MINKKNDYNEIVKDYVILACFSRSFDEYHNNNNRVHLVASTVIIKDIVDSLGNNINGSLYNEFNTNLNKLMINQENYSSYNENKKFIIVNVVNNFLEKSARLNDNILIDSSNSYINININDVISLFNKNPINDTSELISLLFGSLYDTSKSKDKEMKNNIIFLFSNINWSNVVLLFKLCNVDVSGGSITKRHCINTNEIILSNFLLYIFKDMEKIKNIVYNNYKNSLLSNKISLDYYKKDVDTKENLINKKIKNLNISKFEDELNLPNFKLINDGKNNILVNLMIITNLNLLIKIIIWNYDNYLEKYNLNLKKLNSDLEMISYKKLEKKSIHIGDIVGSVKEKKRLKKERTRLNTKLNYENEIKELNKEQQKKQIEIDNIKNEIEKTYIKKEEFISNIGEYSLVELNNMYINSEFMKGKKNTIFNTVKRQIKNHRNFSSNSLKNINYNLINNFPLPVNDINKIKNINKNIDESINDKKINLYDNLEKTYLPNNNLKNSLEDLNDIKINWQEMAINTKIKGFEDRKTEFYSKILAKLEEQNKFKDIVENPDKYSKTEFEDANIKVNYINSQIKRIEDTMITDGVKITKQVKQI